MKVEQNPKALKHLMSKSLLEKMSQSLQSEHPAFDTIQFKKIFGDFENLELKTRVQKISATLHDLLPQKYPDALKIIVAAANSPKLSGFDLWPFTEFIQTYGLDYPHESLEALEQLTQKFTGEFAIRPFLKHHPKLSYEYLNKWVKSKNVHVRRLVSEGSRPRLPWGERLQQFIHDPRPNFPLLNMLKTDPELYVRKSVANHLNDISKDHPNKVIQILEKWIRDADKDFQIRLNWIVRHSLRTLVKDGNPKALQLLGVKPLKDIVLKKMSLHQKTVHIGEGLTFEFDVFSNANKMQKIVIDYAIHFRKANGEYARKVFKLKTTSIEPSQKIRIQKTHSLKKITTRKYYVGAHFIEIQINGCHFKKIKWLLKSALS